MINKVKELRTLLPIPINEAMQLLKDNDGDIEKCVYLFKAKAIRDICDLAGCDAEIAQQHYETEKYDFNRTVSSIREAIYDQNYKPVDGITKENVRLVIQWLGLIEAKDFAFSLDYIHLDRALETLALMPSLSEVASKVKKAKEAKSEIFEGYTDDQSLDEFVRRHKRLDDNSNFRSADAMVPLKITVIKEELLRHLRNLNE